MAFTKPYFALGVPIQNCNFQLPGDAGGLAAGWEYYSGSANLSPFGGFPGLRVGRQAAQYVTIAASSSGIIVSAPSDPYHMTISGNTKVFSALDLYVTHASVTVSLGVGFYNAAGGLIGPTVSPLITKSGACNGVYTDEDTVNIPAAAVFVKVFVSLANAAITPQTAVLFFAGAGCWDASTSGSFQPTRYYIHPGTTGRQVSVNAGLSRNDLGVTRVVDRARNGRGNVVNMAFSQMPTSDMMLFQRLAGLNGGRNWSVAGAQSNPTGGSWPILLVPGHTGLVSAMLCDLTSGASFDPDEEWGRQDPPLWQGTLEFSERT